jgi:hypothetical protein
MDLLIFIICLIAIISLFNATLIFSLRKWGWFEWYETYKPVWLKWVKQCVFCFGFRVAAVEIILLSFWVPSWFFIIIPFCAASLTFLIVSK